MSAYAWSLLTNRIFLININRPCELDKFIEPNNINWTMKENYTLENRYIHRITTIDSLTFKDSIKKFTLNQFESQKKYIVIRNNIDWLEAMSQNENIKEKLIQLGFQPSKYEIFQK